MCEASIAVALIGKVILKRFARRAASAADMDRPWPDTTSIDARLYGVVVGVRAGLNAVMERQGLNAAVASAGLGQMAVVGAGTSLLSSTRLALRCLALGCLADMAVVLLLLLSGFGGGFML